MITTNTIQLTETQEDNLKDLVRELFTDKVSDDWSHFSFEGTRLNFKSKRVECIFEVHSKDNSFNILIDLNENKKGLKSTFTLIKW